MKKEPQIFTQIDKQNVPVSLDILDTLEAEEISESLVRKYIRTILEAGELGQLFRNKGQD